VKAIAAMPGGLWRLFGRDLQQLLVKFYVRSIRPVKDLSEGLAKESGQPD